MKIVVSNGRVKNALRWAERGSWAAGSCLLACCGVAIGESRWAQWQGRQDLDQQSIAVSPAAAAPQRRFLPDALATIDVPGTGISAVVFEGSGDSTLARG